MHDLGHWLVSIWHNNNREYDVGLYLMLKVYIPFEEGSEQDAAFRSLSTGSRHPFECTLLLA